MSNGDRIRSMTDEELAMWIAPHLSCKICPYRAREGCDESECFSATVEWLKQGVQEDAGND